MALLDFGTIFKVQIKTLRGNMTINLKFNGFSYN